MAEVTSVNFIVESLRPEVQFVIKHKQPKTIQELIMAIRTSPTVDLLHTQGTLQANHEQLTTLTTTVAAVQHNQQQQPPNNSYRDFRADWRPPHQDIRQE